MMKLSNIEFTAFAGLDWADSNLRNYVTDPPGIGIPDFRSGINTIAFVLLFILFPQVQKSGWHALL